MSSTEASTSCARIAAARSLSTTPSFPINRGPFSITGTPPPPLAITMTPSATSVRITGVSTIEYGSGLGTTRRHPPWGSAFITQPRCSSSFFARVSLKNGPTNFVGLRNAGSFGRTRVSERIVTTGRSIARSKKTSPIVTWRRYPICPCDSAPQTSSGIGWTCLAAASCWIRIRPTCGPLPWVTTTSQPSAAISAMRSAAPRAARYISSYVSSAPRRSRALPPRATTTRSTGSSLQNRRQDVGELRRVWQHVEVVAHPHGGLSDVDHPAQVDRGADHHEVDVGRIDDLRHLVQLAVAVAHRGQHGSDVVSLERLGDRSDRPGTGIDDLGRAQPLRGDHAGTDLHLAVGQRRAVLHHEDALATHRLGVVARDLRVRLDHDGAGVGPRDRPLELRDLLRRRGVHLVDHDHPGRPQVGLPGVVAELVSRPERIHQGDPHGRAVEREIVVAAVPQQHVAFGLRLLQDRSVVDPRVDDGPRHDVRLILLAFLDRAVVAVEVGELGVPLHALRREVPVRHRVANGDHTLAGRLEGPGDRAGERKS